MRRPSPITTQRSSWVAGAVAAACAAAWMIAEFVNLPASYAAASLLILGAFCVPPTRRRRGRFALAFAAAALACLAGLFVAALSDLRGPPFLWLVCFATTGLALAVPVAFAATFPRSKSEKDL